MVFIHRFQCTSTTTVCPLGGLYIQVPMYINYYSAPLVVFIYRFHCTSTTTVCPWGGLYIQVPMYIIRNTSLSALSRRKPQESILCGQNRITIVFRRRCLLGRLSVYNRVRSRGCTSARLAVRTNGLQRELGEE